MKNEKKCKGCKRIKGLNSFYTDKYNADGREGKCKICRSLRRFENQDRVLVYRWDVGEEIRQVG